MFETLENRRLLTTIVNGPLVVDGTAANDTILITQSNNVITVKLNGAIETYYASSAGGGNWFNSYYAVTKIVVNGLGGNDVIKGETAISKPFEIRGGPGNDSIQGGSGNDMLYGGLGSSPTNISAESGQDTIDGGWGDDFIQASYYKAGKLYGSYRNDTIIGSNGDDTVYGGSGNDSISAGVGEDWLCGEAGNDTISGGDDSDVIDGGDDNDSINGGNGSDWLEGGAGWDTLKGDAGNDTLKGNAGGDRLLGGANVDTVSYESYSQNLIINVDIFSNDGPAGEFDEVGSDVEVIVGGSGNDQITAGAFASQLIGNGGADTLKGGAANDILTGGAGNDVLHGMGGNDALFGNDSDDNLFGGAGDDRLSGDAGSDTLVAIGGGGHDTLLGGAGDLDSFWMDAGGFETADVEPHEVDARAMHQVASFANGAGTEPNGEDLADPAVSDPSQDFYISTNPFAGNRLFGSTGPSRDDVRQAGLGTCWFLATLSAVADQNPNLIRQSVVELGDGSYAVMFFEDGDPKFYRVDSDLPVFSAGALAYAQPGQQGAMWVPIMEKAYAFHEGDGDYEEIEGGSSDTAYDDLGIANESIDVDDDNVLQTIADQLAAGRAVTIDTVSGDFTMGDTLVANHVYTVISVNVAAGTIRLRNPWGSDAGGGFVQGADDGYVNFSFDQAFRDLTEDFWVGFV